MTDKPIRVALADDSGLEQAVVAYLTRHGDFFDRHADLLVQLRVPHSAGEGSVSLIERQVEALRAELGRYKEQIRQLVEVARDNDRLTRRLHEMNLELIQAGDYARLVEILQARLREQFEADAVALHLAPQDQDPCRRELSGLLESGRPLCGRLTQERRRCLFGDQAEAVQSAVLLPLGVTHDQGLLAIGSGDPDRFHPGMGTELLERLAEVVTAKLGRVSLPGV